MTCEQCGGSQGELKSGVSKKNGKPYKGFKCLCGHMTFLKTNGNGGSNYPPKTQAPTPDIWSEILLEIKQIRIALQKIANPSGITDSEAPF